METAILNMGVLLPHDVVLRKNKSELVNLIYCFKKNPFETMKMFVFSLNYPFNLEMKLILPDMGYLRIKFKKVIQHLKGSQFNREKNIFAVPS